MAGRRRWNRLLMGIVAIILSGEIASLVWLDSLPIRSLASWTRPTSRPGDPKLPSSGAQDGDAIGDSSVQSDCEAWLEEEDKLPAGRNFATDPVLVIMGGESKEWESCGVGCVHKSNGDNPDGAFTKGTVGPPYRKGGTSHIIRSMESASYYPENNLATAHDTGYDVVMTTSLASDVPVGYFSWAEYDIMAPVQAKDHDSVAAAFISNCAAHNFRLDAVGELQKFINVDSFGKCNRNRESSDKLETLRHYKFSLAFENSNEDDYVTEKFWQSLVAGSVPVVVGAPNIEDFAPAPNSYLHIKSLDDVSRVASQIRYLNSNATAYNETLRWKHEGPSKAFKALVDMAAVHSSCRLCIHLATTIRSEELSTIADAVAKRPCKCTDVLGIVSYHIYVRERGRFEFESVYVTSTDLSIAGLEAAILVKFRSLKYVPIWYTERPKAIRGDGSLNIYRIYPVGLTQRDALYSVYFHSDDNVKGHFDDNPCPKLEVIFV